MLKLSPCQGGLYITNLPVSASIYFGSICFKSNPSTDIMDIAESSRLYAVRKDISGHLKSGMLDAEACIERDEYDFYITPDGDRNGITIYHPSHEYGDIVETIKEVMAPYGLTVNYAETTPEKTNGEDEK